MYPPPCLSMPMAAQHRQRCCCWMWLCCRRVTGSCSGLHVPVGTGSGGAACEACQHSSLPDVKANLSTNLANLCGRHNPCTYSDAAQRSRKTVWCEDLHLLSPSAEAFGGFAPGDNLPRTCPPSTDHLLAVALTTASHQVVLLWCCLECQYLALIQCYLSRMHLLTHAFHASVAIQRQKRLQLHIQLVSSPRE